MTAYLRSLKGVDMAALKLASPAEYMSILRSIARKFLRGRSKLRFDYRDKETGRIDLGHLLQDEARSLFIHTLPRTMKDYDIKAEFLMPDGRAKAYLIKKYFDVNIQKDIWDVMVFHQMELTAREAAKAGSDGTTPMGLRTKITRKSEKGRRYVENILLKENKK